MLTSTDWLALVATLPTENKAARMRLWRALKALGCAALRDGVYLLPALTEAQAALARLAAEVRTAGGSAEVLTLATTPEQDASFRRQFDRSAEYGRLLTTVREAVASGDPRTAHALRREFNTIAATDYFPGPARSQLEAALADLSALASGEPRPGQAAIRRLASVDFSGRIWATRKRLWVDRMASAWLIQRFIDPQAQFCWLDDPKKCPKKALGFDFDGAAFTHVGERVTFEVLAASFSLDTDPALARIAAIVHFLDVGGAPVAEAAGIEAVLAGLRAAAADDDRLLAEARRVFDSLYTNYQQEKPHV